MFADRPLARFEEAARFWTAVTGTRLSERRGADGEFATLLPPSGDAHLRLQGVRDGDGGAHLDLAVADLAAAVRVARSLGAVAVGEAEGLAVFTTPAGQGFCLTAWDGSLERPPAAEGSGGVRTRVDQLCLDVPPSAHAAELEFWSSLTGWPVAASDHPEFTKLVPQGSLPVRLLVQRRADETPPSAHLDLSCSDVAAATAWHVSEGARVVEVFGDWTVMADPAGGVYCLTARRPLP
ncbi:VOC family protein [Actinomadura flavalba]|uniref:VOC family protein n=1 Tax=Actinomadura flavalba TaxID=1120938 RepID=UPI001969CA38|nr:VOC family protein [Actinomadura flavalba]